MCVLMLLPTVLYKTLVDHGHSTSKRTRTRQHTMLLIAAASSWSVAMLLLPLLPAVCALLLSCFWLCPCKLLLAPAICCRCRRYQCHSSTRNRKAVPPMNSAQRRSPASARSTARTPASRTPPGSAAARVPERRSNTKSFTCMCSTLREDQDCLCTQLPSWHTPPHPPNGRPVCQNAAVDPNF